MNGTFTASNGIELRLNANGWVERRNSTDLGTCRWDAISGLNVDGPSLVWDAIREFFLHERDKELGRWRWPENPDYVVHMAPAGERVPDARHVTVSNESSGEAAWLFEVAPGGVSGGSSWARDAARAYFAAHPEPKPWHSAEPGEVWELTYLPLGEPKRSRPFVVDSFGKFRTTQGVRVDPFQEIVDGRRIWPEVVS